MPWNLEDKVKWTELTPSLKKKFMGVEESANSIAKFGSDQLSNTRVSISRVTPVAPINNYDLWIDEKYRIGRAFTEDNWEFTRAAWANGSYTPSSPPSTEVTPPPGDSTPAQDEKFYPIQDTYSTPYATIYETANTKVSGGFMYTIKESWSDKLAVTTVSSGSGFGGTSKAIAKPTTYSLPKKTIITGKNIEIFLDIYVNTFYPNRNYGNAFVVINSDKYVIPIKTYATMADTINEINKILPPTKYKSASVNSFKISATVELGGKSFRKADDTSFIPTSQQDVKDPIIGGDFYPGYQYYFDLTEYVKNNLGGDSNKLSTTSMATVLTNANRNSIGKADPPFDTAFSQPGSTSPGEVSVVCLKVSGEAIVLS